MLHGDIWQLHVQYISGLEPSHYTSMFCLCSIHPIIGVSERPILLQLEAVNTLTVTTCCFCFLCFCLFAPFLFLPFSEVAVAVAVWSVINSIYTIFILHIQYFAIGILVYCLQSIYCNMGWLFPLLSLVYLHNS